MNNMTKIILKCENISYEAVDESIFSNQKKVILDNISFDVYENEILSIAGESGSGKTTLGKILSGILKPTAGEIKYFFNQNNYDKIISLVQFLFQNNGELINPLRSVESILNEAIQKAGKKAFVKSVDELLRIFSLPESIKIQKGYTLSGGQQQRVALARILAVNPQLIILDEPFSAQDKESVDNLVSIIKKIRNDSGKTIICISHDIKVLKNISDRLVIMKDGKIVETGVAQKIFSNPQNEFTKFLMKASELQLTAEEVKTFLKKYEQN
mgnify:FL=1